MKWRKLSGERIHLPINQAVEKAVIREQAVGHQLTVCIGSDSQVNGDVIDYATVIVFLREKKGGFMFITNYSERRIRSIKDRMINEVVKSIEVAHPLCDLLESYGVPLEVHADINTDPNFNSNVALKEAMGYILGMGFVFKAKPNAFASSYCADKMI